MLGVDIGFGKVRGKTIKDAGYNFVCRYLSNNPEKNLTKDEVLDFKTNNLNTIVVWETTEDRALHGFSAGRQDAFQAQEQCNLLQINPPCIYFAVDFDLEEDSDDSEAVLMYFGGIATVLGTNRIGIYGGLTAVKLVLDHGVASFGWQTFAWSHKIWDPRAQLRQIRNGVPVLEGVQCDEDEAQTNEFGQF